MTMGTRSSISIRNEDGSVTGIYCQFDGYLSHNGQILYKHYRDPSKIRELMDLGFLSGLGSNVRERNPYYSHTTAYDNWRKLNGSDCDAYHRDSGYPKEGPITKPTLEELMEHLNQEYDYLYENGEWMVNYYKTDGEWVNLEYLLVVDGLLEGVE